MPGVFSGRKEGENSLENPPPALTLPHAKPCRVPSLSLLLVLIQERPLPEGRQGETLSSVHRTTGGQESLEGSRELG